MTDSISCNFARCAVRHLMSAGMKGNIVPKGIMPEIIREYNHNFLVHKAYMSRTQWQQSVFLA